MTNVEEYIIFTDVETNTYTVSTPTVSMSFDTLQKAREWASLIATKINGGN